MTLLRREPICQPDNRSRSNNGGFRGKKVCDGLQERGGVKHDRRDLIYTAIGRDEKVTMPLFGRRLQLHETDEEVSKSL